MFSTAFIHDTLAPAGWTAALEQSLRTRELAPRFLYESPKQAQRWLELHARYSPARQDPHCVQLYEEAAAFVATQLKPGSATVIGLGCGGGQKEVALLEQLNKAGHEVGYVPLDASLPLVLTAANAAHAALPAIRCQPVVADLFAAADLPDLLAHAVPLDHVRVFTFYGMLPNVEPEVARAQLKSWMRPGDWLLLSANLAPGKDYAAGVRQILPQYDNSLMRQWLLTWPSDAGVDLAGTELTFEVASYAGPPDLLRIEARLVFIREQQIKIEGRSYQFPAGDSMRLFFSYRYTPQRVRELLHPTALTVAKEWMTPSGEEGVYAVCVAPQGAQERSSPSTQNFR